MAFFLDNIFKVIIYYIAKISNEYIHLSLQDLSKYGRLPSRSYNLKQEDEMRNPYVSFDSIDLMNEFITAGMNNTVAEKVAQRMAQAKEVIIHEICERDKNFSTKEDLMMITVDIKDLQTEIKILGSELNTRISEVETKLGARISEVETNLGARISEVDTNLNARISEVETNLGAIISEVDTNLNARISEVETNLGARISEVDTNLNARISEVNANLSARISGLDARIFEVNANLSARIDILEIKIDDVYKRTIIWMGGIMIACTGSIIAVFLKFMH